MNSTRLHEELAELVTAGRIAEGGLSAVGGIVYGVVKTAGGVPITVRLAGGQLYADEEPIERLSDAPALAAEAATEAENDAAAAGLRAALAAEDGGDR